MCRKYQILLTLLSIFAVFFAISPIHAQEDTAKRVYEMEEITVTAQPVIEGNNVTRYGETISSVNARQIDDLNAQDIPSALRRVPGVTISRYNMIGNYGGGDGGAVFVRGHGSGRPGSEISTLVDGIPRFSGVWTHPLMDLMSLDFADRIEIQKSAQPVMNGNMSFSSINVIPRRMSSEGLSTRLQSTIGSHATIVERLEHGGKIGGFDYFLTGSHRQSDGHRKNSDGKVQSVYGRVGYLFGDRWDASLQFNHTNGWAFDPLPENTLPTPITQKFNNDNELYIGTVSHKHDTFEEVVKTYYENGYIDWRQWDDTHGEEEHGMTKYGNYGIRFRETMSIFKNNEIIIGLDVDNYGGSFVNIRPSGSGKKTTATLNNTAPYIMASHVFGERFQLIPSVGIRYNINSEFDSQLGYQSGIVFKAGCSQLYTNFSRAFNLPGVYTKIMYSDWWSFAGNPDGWKDLDPEYLKHFEIGGSHRLNDHVSFDVTWFHDDVTNALRIVLPPPPPPTVQNIGEYTTQGIETTVNLTPIPGINTFIGMSYMTTSPDEVPNAPGISLSAGVGYTLFKKIRLNADAEYVDEQYVQGTRSLQELVKVDAYSLLNCRIGYLVPVGSRIGEFFLCLENSTNQKYEFRPGYPMAGRTIMAGLDIRM